jgi:ABC-type glucose/galactose transport system permease subunit
MVNIFRLSKYIISVIMIIAVIWIVFKKTEAMKTLKPGENPNNKISGFDRVMIGVTGIMEKLSPSSPFTREMTEQKNTINNHL